MLAKPMLRPSDWPLRSAASWQSALVMVMLAAGFLSIAASQLALGLALLLMLYRWFVQKERPPFTGLERTAAALALWALAMVPLSTNVAQSALYYRRFTCSPPSGVRRRSHHRAPARIDAFAFFWAARW
ncbi:MAG: hypothetical protein IPJ24_04835 [bacterium]|nr:hypothetical protein [bacterium]